MPRELMLVERNARGRIHAIILHYPSCADESSRGNLIAYTSRTSKRDPSSSSPALPYIQAAPKPDTVIFVLSSSHNPLYTNSTYWYSIFGIWAAFILFGIYTKLASLPPLIRGAQYWHHVVHWPWIFPRTWNCTTPLDRLLISPAPHLACPRQPPFGHILMRQMTHSSGVGIWVVGN